MHDGKNCPVFMEMPNTLYHLKFYREALILEFNNNMEYPEWNDWQINNSLFQNSKLEGMENQRKT